MQVIVEHRVSQAIDGEDRGEKLQAIANPASSVFEGLSGDRVFATEKRASHAALNAVNHLDFSEIKDFTTSLTRHFGRLRNEETMAGTKIVVAGSHRSRTSESSLSLSLIYLLCLVQHLGSRAGFGCAARRRDGIA